MARVIVTDNDGELSQNGLFTNTLFTKNGTGASLNAVGLVTVKTDTAGWTSPDFTLMGSSELSFSLDNNIYSGNSLYLGTIDEAGTQVYVKCITETPNPVSLIVSQVGLVEDTGGVSVAVPTQSLTLNLLDPTIVTGSNTTVTEASASFSVIDPTVTITTAGNVDVIAEVLTIASSIINPTVTGASNTTATTQSATFNIINPTVTGGSGSTTASGPYYFLAASNTLQKGGTAPAEAYGGVSVFHQGVFTANLGAQGAVSLSPAGSAYDVLTIGGTLTANSAGITTITLNGDGALGGSRTFTLPNGETFANGASVALTFKAIGDDDSVSDMFVGTLTKIVVS